MSPATEKGKRSKACLHKTAVVALVALLLGLRYQAPTYGRPAPSAQQVSTPLCVLCDLCGKYPNRSFSASLRVQSMQSSWNYQRARILDPPASDPTYGSETKKERPVSVQYRPS